MGISRGNWDSMKRSIVSAGMHVLMNRRYNEVKKAVLDSDMNVSVDVGIGDMQWKSFKSQHERFAALTNKSASLIVAGAASDEVNGVYNAEGFFSGVPGFIMHKGGRVFELV